MKSLLCKHTSHSIYNGSGAVHNLFFIFLPNIVYIQQIFIDFTLKYEITNDLYSYILQKYNIKMMY